MKTNQLFLLLILFAVSSYAQQQKDTVKYWDLGGKSSLSLSQTGQVNWVQGGVPSISYQATAELFVRYNKEKINWETEAKFFYGQQTQGYTKDFRVSDDRIDIASKYGYKISKDAYLSVLAGFKSQFVSGYEYPDDLPKVQVSEFLSPASITGAIGVDYKPNENTSIFASVLSAKLTMVNDTALDETKYGLDNGETIRKELGAFLKATNKLKIAEGVEFENNIELFSNYIDKPQNIDIVWNSRIEMSVNKYLKTVFSTTLIYDDNIAIPVDINNPETGTTKAIQFKEMLSVGFLINF